MTVNCVMIGDAIVATLSFVPPSDLHHVRHWIVHGSWSGAVDVVCTHWWGAGTTLHPARVA